MSIKKAVIFLAIMALSGSVAMYYLVNKRNNTVYSTVKASRGVIMQTVSETGMVKAANELDLSFYNSGRISAVHVKIGDMVEKDQLLAELDYSSLVIKESEAKAGLDYARFSLDKLLAGATSEEIDVVEAEVSKAKSSYASYKVELEKTKNSADESIRQAQKTLNDLESDSIDSLTPEEHAVSAAETSLNNARTTYQNSINNQIESSLSVMEDKIIVGRTALDRINRILTDEDAKDLISKDEPEHLPAATQAYSQGKQLLDTASTALSTAKSNKTNQNVDSALIAVLNGLNKVFEALNKCFTALEHSVTSSDFTLAELSAFKTDVNAQETLVSTAVSLVQTSKQNFEGAILSYNTNISTAEDALKKAKTDYENAVKNAKNALSTAETAAEQQISAVQAKIDSALENWQVAEAKLKETKAPPNRHDISLAEAKLRQAEVAMEDIAKQIEDHKIISPIAGIITRVKYDAGEQVPQGTHMISVLADDNFEIEVLISEADIAKIKVGNPAEMTLDSFSDDVKFIGEVSFIEPAETVIQDVIYYKVKVNFEPGEQKVKSGMTANAKILAASKDNVLLVPSGAVIDKNREGKFVRVLTGQSPVLKKVETGLRGDNGLVEITSGLKEGELVVEYVKEKK